MNDTLLTTGRFSVQRRAYSHPTAGVVHRELVVHPGAVVILPLAEDGTVVLIRNYRFAVGCELLELPAGTLEAGEEPIACAARELEEETGYRAERIVPLARFYTSPGFTDERMHAFVATGLSRTEQRLDATEQIRVETMPLSGALAATLDGRIVDGKSIAALHVYHYGKVMSL